MSVVQATTLPDNCRSRPFRAQAEALLAMPHHYLLATQHPYAAGYMLLQAMPQAQADILTLYAAHRSTAAKGLPTACLPRRSASPATRAVQA